MFLVGRFRNVLCLCVAPSSAASRVHAVHGRIPLLPPVYFWTLGGVCRVQVVVVRRRDIFVEVEHQDVKSMPVRYEIGRGGFFVPVVHI